MARRAKPKQKKQQPDGLRRRREALDAVDRKLALGGPNDWQVVKGDVRPGVGRPTRPERGKPKPRRQGDGPSGLTERRMLDPIESPEGQAFIAEFVKKLELAQAVSQDLGLHLGRVTDRYIRECRDVIERHVMRMKRGAGPVG